MSHHYDRPQDEWEQPVSTLDWFLTLLVLSIPIVNIIMALVWAFGGTGQISKQNYARALLIWMLLGIVLSVVFGLLMFSIFGIAAVNSGGASTHYIP